jgi:hypothetical protein
MVYGPVAGYGAVLWAVVVQDNRVREGYELCENQSALVLGEALVRMAVEEQEQEPWEDVSLYGS